MLLVSAQLCRNIISSSTPFIMNKERAQISGMQGTNPISGH